MVLGRGWSLDCAPEEGTSTSAFVLNNGGVGSGTFCSELMEDQAVVVVSVLTLSLRVETRLLRSGATGVDWEVWKVEWEVLLTWSLPAGLSTLSTSCEVEGKAALPVAAEAAGGSSWVSKE